MNVNTISEHELPGNMDTCVLHGCRKKGRIMIAWQRGEELYCKDHAVRHLLSKRVTYARIVPETVMCDLR